MVLLRHGTAVARGLAGLDDAERPLVAEGEREARDAGRALRALRVRPTASLRAPSCAPSRRPSSRRPSSESRCSRTTRWRPASTSPPSMACSRATTATASCSSVTTPTSRPRTRPRRRPRVARQGRRRDHRPAERRAALAPAPTCPAPDREGRLMASRTGPPRARRGAARGGATAEPRALVGRVQRPRARARARRAGAAARAPAATSRSSRRTSTSSTWCASPVCSSTRARARAAGRPGRAARSTRCSPRSPSARTGRSRAEPPAQRAAARARAARHAARLARGAATTASAPSSPPRSWRHLPRPDPARRRPRSALPVHLEPLALARGARPRSPIGRSALRAGQGARRCSRASGRSARAGRYLPLEELIAAPPRVALPGHGDRGVVGVFRVTRDADLEIQTTSRRPAAGDGEELRRRRFGDVVRLELDAGTSRDARAADPPTSGSRRATSTRSPGCSTSRLMSSSPRRAARAALSAEWPPASPRPSLQPPARALDPDVFAIHAQEATCSCTTRTSRFDAWSSFVTGGRRSRVLAIKQTLYRTCGDSPMVPR